MRLGVDIGIDADGDGRALAQRASHLIQGLKFRFALDIELIDARFEPEPHFAFGFADARKYDSVRGNARYQRFLQFAARHDVGAGTQISQGPQHCQIAVGFDRIGDQRVFGQRLDEDAVMALQRRRRIAIKRRADARRQRRQFDVFGMECAVSVMKVVHRPIGDGGLVGSFSLLGVDLPSGSTRSLFTPQPEAASRIAKASAKRRIISVFPSRRQSARARVRARYRRNSCAKRRTHPGLARRTRLCRSTVRRSAFPKAAACRDRI